MDVHHFISRWKAELADMPFNEFIANMNHLKVTNQSYCNWIKTWLAWSELASDDDIDASYDNDNDAVTLDDALLHSLRDYTRLDTYLDHLAISIYDQPSDPGHTAWAKDAIQQLFPRDVKSVLDVGCGDGFCLHLFQEFGVEHWQGTTFESVDYKSLMDKGRSATFCDMTFLDFADNSFDMVFARHTLEHSPMPLLTLMEWWRVSNKYAMIVLPAAEYWGKGGRNHYYVLEKPDWETLFDAAGWNILRYQTMTSRNTVFLAHNNATPNEVVVEFRWLLEKRHDRKNEWD